MADNNGDGIDDITGLPVGPSGGGGQYPISGTPAEQRKWLLDHGYNPDTFGNNPTSPGAGFVIGRNGELIPQGTGPTASGGIPAGELFDMGGTVYRWNGKTYTKASVADTKAYWNSGGGYSVDNSTGTGFAGNASAADIASGGGGSGGSAQRLTTDDPRYWQLEYDQLAEKYMNDGLDAESARRQALATLIANRNNTAVSVGQLSADIAKQKADYQAHGKDAFAELYYANQVGGAAPFSNINTPEGANYRNALKEKGNAMFTDVNADLERLRIDRDSIPPVDFYGAETRSAIGLPPTPAQALTGESGVLASASPPPEVNGLQALQDRLAAMSPQEQWDFRNYSTQGEYGKSTPRPLAKGGSLNFDTMFADRGKPGFSPSSSEGGTNLNIHERAVVVGESGQVYATLGERRPDGSIRSESLQVKPLKSETDKDKKLEEGHKAVVESQKKTLAAFAGGGQINANPTPEDLMQQLSQYLNSLGGSGGGTGAAGRLPDPRLLAGAPWAALQANRRKMELAGAGYESIAGGGISPQELEDTVKLYTPQDARQVRFSAPQVTW